MRRPSKHLLAMSKQSHWRLFSLLPLSFLTALQNWSPSCSCCSGHQNSAQMQENRNKICESNCLIIHKHDEWLLLSNYNVLAEAFMYTGQVAFYNRCNTQALCPSIQTSQQNPMVLASVPEQPKAVSVSWTPYLTHINRCIFTHCFPTPLKVTKKFCFYQPKILTKTVNIWRYCLQKDLWEERPREVLLVSPHRC